MDSPHPTGLPICPVCRIVLMWPIRGGWQCEGCGLVKPGRSEHDIGDVL